MWEIASVQCVQTLEGHTGVVMDLLCWDSFLLSCSLDGTVKASVEAMARFSRVCGGSLCMVCSGNRTGKWGRVGGLGVERERWWRGLRVGRRGAGGD